MGVHSNKIPKEGDERELDRIDFGILEALQNDANLSNKELAALVGLAPSSALERVRRLRKRGVLGPAHSVVSPKALGIHLQAVVQVQLRNHDSADIARFRDRVFKRKEVVALYYVGGSDDFLLHIAVPNVEYLRRHTLPALTAGDVVRHIETALVFESHHKAIWPNYQLDEGEPA